MRYLGGKTRIAKRLAEQINRFREPGAPFWDPFCGGLSMAVALGGEGLVSDAHPALIAVYRAVAAGWDPPKTLTESEWRAAKELPDSDPLKAFAGFGCSFGGKWFGGYAAPAPEYFYNANSKPRLDGSSREGERIAPKDFADEARRALLRDVPTLTTRGCVFDCVDFLSITPVDLGALLYLDPPYRNTTGYSLPFDHDAFDVRAREWAAAGTPC